MKPGPHKPAGKRQRIREKEAKQGHPSLGAGGSARHWNDRLRDDDLQFIAEALTFGKLIAPTPFSELARQHPSLWKQALKVFGKPEAARIWLETRSGRFDGQRPLSVAMRAGGEQKVFRELLRLRRKPTTKRSSKAESQE